MKRLALVLLLAVLAAPLLAQAPARKRVAVLDFDYATVRSYVSDIWGSDVDIGKGIADMLVTELVRNGTYSVIERKQLDRVLGEQNFQQSGRADASTAAQLGRILGVDAMIIGSITQFGRDDKKLGIGAGGVRFGGIGIGGVGRRSAKAVVQIDARVVDIRTAEILGVATGFGESKRSGMRGLLRQNDKVILDMCVSPNVALPLAVTMDDSDGSSTTVARLAEFRP